MNKNIVALIVVALIVVVGGVAWQAALRETPPQEPVTATTTPATSETTTVRVYFGNEIQNPGALDCSRVYAVTRTIPKTEGVARAAIAELLKGPTAAERGQGYLTSINSGVKINSLRIVEGQAQIDFDERLGEQVGGACLVSAIRAQIQQTLLQFPTVVDVVISINGQTEDILQP